jgi:hypothetical protein
MRSSSSGEVSGSPGLSVPRDAEDGRAGKGDDGACEDPGLDELMLGVADVGMGGGGCDGKGDE